MQSYPWIVHTELNLLGRVEFRLITPAGVPFASHATDQLDYLAGEVRVVPSPGASLPATLTGFSTWQRVDFNH